jgi:hypothetical protein
MFPQRGDSMRCVLALLTLLSIALPTTAQNATASQIIQRMVEDGAFEGHDQKIIGGMGDASAVIITKILAGRSVGSAHIDNVLVVLDHSFADVRLVELPSDREPRTVLFVLNYLDSSTTEPQLKQRIAETRSRITNNFAKYGRTGATQ